MSALSVAPTAKPIEPFNALNTIIELMNSDKFRELFDTNFNTFSDIESVILVMKAYQYLEKLYIETYHEKPSREYMRHGIQQLIANKPAREFLLDSMKRFVHDGGDFARIMESQQLLTSITLDLEQ